jgi:hypothetical protein
MVYLFIKPKPAETLVIEGILHFSIEYLIKNKIQASKKIDRKLQVEQHVIAIKGTKAKTETPTTKLLCLSSQFWQSNNKVLVSQLPPVWKKPNTR